MTQQRSRYFGDDKDIYDLIISSKLKLTEDVLWELALRRGLVFSANMSRHDMAMELSKIPHCWHDLQKLFEASAVAVRRPRMVSETMNCALNVESLHDTVHAVGRARLVSAGEEFSVRRGSKSVSVTVKYTEVDYSHNRLQQRRELSCAIEFVARDEGYSVRRSDSDRALAILRDVEAEIRKADASAGRLSIGLSAISSAEGRTKFFLSLIKGIAGFKTIDINKVKLVPVAVRKRASDAARLHDADGALEDDKLEIEAESKIRSLVIKGDNLLKSSIMKSLEKSGHYIAGLTWLAQEVQADGYHVIFRAQIREGSDDGGFTYSVSKPYLSSLEDGRRRPRAERRVAPSEAKLQELLETAALAAHKKILAEYSMPRMREKAAKAAKAATGRTG